MVTDCHGCQTGGHRGLQQLDIVNIGIVERSARVDAEDDDDLVFVLDTNGDDHAIDV